MLRALAKPITYAFLLLAAATATGCETEGDYIIRETFPHSRDAFTQGLD